MKKRINSSEIEKARRSNRFLFILTVLMLLVVIGGLIFYVLYDKNLINFGDASSNEESIISKNEVRFDLKLTNKEATRLFNIVRVSNNSCRDYVNSKNIKTKELSEECKYEIASNIYNRYTVDDNGIIYVLEDDVSYAYESLFGENTYKVQELIPYKDNSKFYYSEVNKKYILQGDYVETDSNMNNYEEVLSIKKDNNYLYINSAIMYYESINKNICRDYNCNEIVEKIDDEPSPDYYSLYIKHNKNKLYNYHYKFKLDKNGFYKYIGYEKTIK